jgi:amidohydrolase
VNASSDEFTITVSGTGGHAAYPHVTDDPVVALAQVVVVSQSVVSRSVDPVSPAVLGVSALAAGSAANVVPGSAVARGTVRAMSAADRQLIHDRLTGIATSVAAVHGCVAEVEVVRGEPVLVDDAEFACEAAVFLRANEFTVTDVLRSMGVDDFSFFSERVPSLMMFVGTRGERLHRSTFLPEGAAVCRVVLAMIAGYRADRSVLQGATAGSEEDSGA